MSRYLGRVTLNLNGTIVDSRPGASLDVGGVQRTAVVNDQGMGYSEALKPSRIDAEFSLREGVAIEPFRNLTNATGVFACDTGQRYIIKDAYTAETPTLTGGEGGRVKLVIEGKPAEEVVS